MDPFWQAIFYALALLCFIAFAALELFRATVFTAGRVGLLGLGLFFAFIPAFAIAANA